MNREELKNKTLDIESTSQNYQDVFALLVAGLKSNGNFIDIGCSVPNHCSNVLLLLNSGWKGLGFDLNPNITVAWQKYPGIQTHCFNVVDQWDSVNSKIEEMPSIVDYLNIDVDGYPTQHVIERINLETRKYRCITIEHDAYRFGDVYKDAQRNVLLRQGYEIVITSAAEDWYVYPELLDTDYYSLLKSIPTHMIYDRNVHDIREFIGFGGIHKGPYV
jgi:hypothetical protein